MADGNPAKEALSRYGRSLGLEQRMGSWYRVEDNLVASVDLQKSQYGPQYYVIIGLFLKPLMTERLPKPQNAHVTTRLESLALDEREQVARLLDLDQQMPDERRIEKICALLHSHVTPLIEQARSVGTLRGLIQSGPLKNAMVKRSAYPALGLRLAAIDDP